MVKVVCAEGIRAVRAEGTRYDDISNVNGLILHTIPYRQILNKLKGYFQNMDAFCAEGMIHIEQWKSDNNGIMHITKEMTRT
jgi:hypothetical protein